VIDEQMVYDLKLAVDEACTNIITHGYAGMDPGTILLAVEANPRQIRITITDFGHSFEPCETPEPDMEAVLEDRPTGGFGLFIIYQTMDTVDYEADVCGNRLILTKMLQPVGKNES
jgi:serine/threonine-protein kinase RsbW